MFAEISTFIAAAGFVAAAATFGLIEARLRRLERTAEDMRNAADDLSAR